MWRIGSTEVRWTAASGIILTCIADLHFMWTLPHATSHSMCRTPMVAERRSGRVTKRHLCHTCILYRESSKFGTGLDAHLYVLYLQGRRSVAPHPRNPKLQGQPW